MNRCSIYLVAIGILIQITSSCSGGSVDAVSPVLDQNLTKASEKSGVSQTHVWGFYTISIDPYMKTVDAVYNRNTMFTANVVNFINKNPAGLKFKINEIITGANYTDIDIDISITHPFPGLPQYNGYDVRGVFMGDGSGILKYNGDLVYAVDGSDQMMLADPDDGTGGPDGYTRWFNYSEFSLGGMPLFQYTPGKAAPPAFAGTATLNPYRYFADGLNATEDLWTWMKANIGQFGKFTSGATNTRNYYLRFPKNKGIMYGYAIIANWGGVDYHPCNAPEPVAVKVVDSSNVYYISPSQNGGNIILDISVWDWDAKYSGGTMKDYVIYLESTVLSACYQFNSSEMIPTGGYYPFSTYHVEIPADNVKGIEGNEFWVIVEEQGEDYTNDFGVSNLADTDPLAAFFRYPLSVGVQPQNTPPKIEGLTDDISPSGLNSEVSDLNTSVTYILLYTDPDVGQDHVIEYFIENAGTGMPTQPADTMPYDWSLKPLGDYEIWATIDDGYGKVIGGPWNVSKKGKEPGWARTWGSTYQDRGYSVVVDNDGYIYVCGNYYYNVDFDPGPGTAYRNSNGNRDSFICKYDSKGNFIWVVTWDDNASFGGSAQDIACDSDNNIYVTGHFFGINVDFDPGPGQDLHSYHGGGGDPYVTVFDSNGNFKWARNWGSDEESLASVGIGISVDSAHNVYIAGNWWGTGDFDPGPGELILSTGTEQWDAFITKFDSSGNHKWAYLIGGTGFDMAYGCHVDAKDDVYVTGYFAGNLDFDPGPGTDFHNSATEGDNFLWKLSPDGKLRWCRAFGKGYPFRMGHDSSNNIYVCGNFWGTAQFDPDGGTKLLTAKGERDCFFNVFNENGKWLYVRTWDSIAAGGSTGGYVGTGLWVDSNDNIYVSGHFTGTADMDPGPGVVEKISQGGRDAFVTKFDPSGNFLWCNAFGGSSTDDCTMVSVDSSTGIVYATGWFANQCDFDPGPGEDIHIAQGSLDAFLVKYYPDGNW